MKLNLVLKGAGDLQDSCTYDLVMNVFLWESSVIINVVNCIFLISVNSETSPVTKHILEKHVGSPLPSQFKHIFWTFNLRRLAVLIGLYCSVLFTE